ncbi:MAG: 30S ribosomal protein S20 [Actinomycetota bacterium]|nr:30S ribosomal protein S20 [Actinomycetota bacterium]
MANIKSQKKRNLTNEKRRVRNREVRTALKTYIKRFQRALDGGDPDLTIAEFRKASTELDRAVSKGVIHPNNAANRKSAMAKRLNATQGADKAS